MTHKEFKHKGIEYKLYLGNHINSSYPIIKQSGGLKSIDVLVLEGINYDPTRNTLFNKDQYKEIFKNIPNENSDLKIYHIDLNRCSQIIGKIVDVGIALTGYGLGISAIENNNNTRRDFIKNSIKGLSGLILLSPVFSMMGDVTSILFAKDDLGLSNWYRQFKEEIYPSKIVGLREAIIPEIIEKGILPCEKIENPRVGILYGSGHHGIKKVIKNKKSRNRILKTYKRFIKKNSEELNEIHRITSLGKENFKVETIHTKVF
jgi:hypothetical protein